MSEIGKKIIRTPDGLVEYEVALGRDQSKRAYTTDRDTGHRKYQCVCCSRFTLNGVDHCEICGDCGWEDWYECHDAPDQVIRPNYVSLNQAKDIVERFGTAAVSQTNKAGGLSIEMIEKMSPNELARLKTIREEIEDRRR